MIDKQCKVCGRTAAMWTIFGISIGNYCNRCYRDINQRMQTAVKPLLAKIRTGAENAIDGSTCQKCGDHLTGHEDETSTMCRWCVTCASSGESVTVMPGRRHE